MALAALVFMRFGGFGTGENVNSEEFLAYAFYECRLHFTKKCCFTEYHRFSNLLFAGSIQYDDDCHVK